MSLKLQIYKAQGKTVLYPITKQCLKTHSEELRPLVLSTWHKQQIKSLLSEDSGRGRDLLPEKVSLIAVASFWGLVHVISHWYSVLSSVQVFNAKNFISTANKYSEHTGIELADGLHVM